MVDFLRLYAGQIIGLVGSLIVLFVVFILIERGVKYASDGDEEVTGFFAKPWKTVKLVIYALVVMGFVGWFLTALLTNETPRGVIDRSLVKEQQSQFAKDHPAK